MFIARILFALACSSFVLFGNSSVQGQVNPNTQQGIGSYDAFQGGDIDKIVFTSGNAFVHIPLVSYPQRGNLLRLDFSLQSNNKSWWVLQTCPTPSTCTRRWVLQSSGGPLVYPTPTMIPVDDQVLVGGVQTQGDCHGRSGATHTFVVYGSDGSGHGEGFTAGTPPGSLCGGTAATLYTFDGSGIRYSGPNNSNNSPGGTGTVTDRNGVNYPAPTALPTYVAREDPNGNQISLTVTETISNPCCSWSYYYRDTFGRSIPMPPSQVLPRSQSGGTQNAATLDYSGCKGPLPISSAVLWSPPAPASGTSIYKFCYVNVPVQSNFGVAGISEGSGTFSFLQSVVLSNGTAWAFEYNSRNSGDPASVNYGDLTKITFPTGGSISYSYANANFCSHYGGCALPAPPLSRAIASRTVDANDGAGGACQRL